jgi:hypothetical protein
MYALFAFKWNGIRSGVLQPLSNARLNPRTISAASHELRTAMPVLNVHAFKNMQILD